MDFFLKLFFLCFFDQACSISFSPYVYLYTRLDLAFSFNKLDDSLEPYYAFRLIVLVFFGKGKGEKRETKREKNERADPGKAKGHMSFFYWTKRIHSCPIDNQSTRHSFGIGSFFSKWRSPQPMDQINAGNFLLKILRF
jgi:hypothetical protein